MKGKKLLSFFVLTAMVLASAFFVCKQTLAMCGTDLSQVSLSEAMMSGCAQQEHASSAASDHMDLFLQALPLTAPAATPFGLLMVAIGFALLAIWRTRGNDADDGFFEKLKSFIRALERAFTPPPLVLAFRRGILHPKIYA